MAAIDARATRRAESRRLTGRPRAAVSRYAGASSARRTVQHPDVADGPGQAGPAPPRGQSLRRGRLFAQGVGGAKDILMGAVDTFLERIGLGRPELRAWAMYDWANSAFWCTVIVAVFPPFFSRYAAAGLPEGVATSRFAWGTTVAVTIVALMAPVLGAIADHRAMKKKLLAVFLLIGVVATLLMGTVGQGEWLYALVLFVVGNIGVASTLVFYDSLLPHIAGPDELDRVS